MATHEGHGSAKALLRRGAALASVVVLAGAAAGAVADANSGSNAPESDAMGSFSIFSHPPTGLARTVTQSARVNAPPGAILAESNADSEIYALRKAGNQTVGSHVLSERLCVVDLQAGEGGEACGSARQVAENGVSVVNMPIGGAKLAVAGLVPNGVDSVTALDRNGTSYTVPVANNTFNVEDEALATVRYTLPSGETESIDIEALVERQIGS